MAHFDTLFLIPDTKDTFFLSISLSFTFQYSKFYIFLLIQIQLVRLLWQYGLWSFQTGGTKLEGFLPNALSM